MRGTAFIKRMAAPGLLLAMGLAAIVGGCSPSNENTETADKLFEVRRSDLSIGSLLRGTANAKKKYKLYPEASYRNQLTWIERENTYVQKGDVVIRFETQDLLDDIESRKLDLDTKVKQLEIQKEEYKILLSENESTLRVALDRVVSAEESYARYFKYDGRKAKDDSERDVLLRMESLEKARTSYRDKQNEISNTIYDNEAAKQRATDELQRLKDAVESAEQSYNASKFSRKIFKKYTYPNTLTDRINQLQQAELNLRRVEVSTESRVVQKDRDLNNLTSQIERARKELEQVEGYLNLMEIKAPVSGILVYGDPDNTRNRNTEIEVGREYNRNFVIATIPEMDNLVINFEIPEQFRHRVTEGATVIVTPDSIPSLKLTGVVDAIAVVPVYQISWDQTSPKIYNATIVLDRQDEQLVSGMNVQVEIIDQVIEDAVNIPVESVFEEEGEYYVFLKDGGKIHRRIIQIGKSNDQYVHVVDGLEVGDYIYLYSPYKLDPSE